MPHVNPPLQNSQGKMLLRQHSSWKQLNEFPWQTLLEGTINEKFGLEIPQDSMIDFQVSKSLLISMITVP